MKDHLVGAVKCPQRGGYHFLAIRQRVSDGDDFAVSAMNLGLSAGPLNVEDEVYRDGSLCMVWQGELYWKRSAQRHNR